MPRKNWIQKAIKRPGRLQEYMRRKYGRKAFNKDGTIKVSYIKKAIKEAKNIKNPELRRSVLAMLHLGLRLKRMARKK